ncbi:penicillin-binding protein 2 [Spirochaeta africana]|uniref:Penicillin-binding protein 2 n=1 Tax=Spirochaeta africana (strain ATCC 700263 / DSM 8902 / Z-7692) TaxID=889378 RepID=H9UJ73_SPIAZ|nr:penicillin-binding protein 2 [Spirochaeta africana]AFG37566.1 penicillin-binding protein 2 [Spirochaeta africana DSM 8902]
MNSSVDRAHSPITSKFRTIIVLVIFLAITLVYALHLFSMQVVDQYVYLSRAEVTTRRSSPIPAKRGEIYDRSYSEPLAGNALAFAVDFTPADAPNSEIPRILSELARLLDVSEDSLHRRVPTRAYNSYNSIELAGNVNYRTIVQLSETIQQFPGVNFYSRPIRHYPHGSSMAHVLGFVGEITPEELQILFNQGYTAQSIIGKAGIERQYDSWLQGKDGRRYRRVDAQGRQVPDPTIEDVPPELGHNLVLSIDARIQELAVNALGSRTGSAVVLKPSTGEILAMASYPSFDPTAFIGRDSQQVIARLSRDARAPFINRAAQAAGSPASTFKILLTAAALEEQVIGLNETINTRLYYQIGNRRVGEHGASWRVSGFGPINLPQALTHSSNYFYAKLGHEYLGPDIIIDYAQRFGFGSQTGIDLPIETAGLLPDRDWKRRTTGEPWVGGDTVNLSLGQGFIETTPLQLANMIALIVNDGIVYTPHLLKEIRDQETGRLVERRIPSISRTVQLSDETFQTTREAMRKVVSDGSTSSLFITPNLEVAGKTGTGEVGLEDQWHSWFAAYAPYETDDPDEQVVVVVWVDASNEWEWWAPKAASIIFHGIFNDFTYSETIEDLVRRRAWFL